MGKTADGAVKRDLDEATKKRLNAENGGMVYKSEYEGCDGNVDMGIKWYNHRDCRTSEMPSANVLASAKGLAKLGAYMANKGTFEGKTIMSEQGFDNMHGDLNQTIERAFNCNTECTNGGVFLFLHMG